MMEIASGRILAVASNKRENGKSSCAITKHRKNKIKRNKIAQSPRTNYFSFEQPSFESYEIFPLVKLFYIREH